MSDAQAKEMEQNMEGSEEIAELTAEDVVEQKSPVEIERDEWKDKAYRLAAEMENLKRRTQREVEEAHKYAITKFARELLSVQDNMERALDVIEKANLEASVTDGVKMVTDQMSKAFASSQIEKIECMGEKLNPELHQAMMEMPSEQEPGTIVQEIQAGYTIAGRLLRPALVGVAKKQEQSAE